MKRRDNRTEHETVIEVSSRMENTMFTSIAILQFVCNIFGTIVSYFSAGRMTLLVASGIVIGIADLVIWIIFKKICKPYEGTWIIILMFGILRFPPTAYYAGMAVGLYMLYIVGIIPFISRRKNMLRNYLMALALHIVVFFFLRKISPAWQAIPPMGFYNFVFGFVMASASFLAMEVIMLGMYEKLAEQVTKESQYKSQFLARMSHEIRTPINAIIGMNEMVLRKSGDKSVIRFASSIKSSASAMLDLVNDILDMSKINAGKMEVARAEYSLSGLVRKMVSVVAWRAKDKGLNFSWNVNEQLPDRLYGDDVKILQVVSNLLTNAAKYTDEGSVTLNIDGKVTDSKLMLYVSVEDTGRGILDEDKEHLLDAFTRAETSYTRNLEGTGLGLNITARLLNLMGSELKFESEYGSGSKFWFVLEQDVMDTVPVGELLKSGRDANGNALTEETFLAPQARLLFVDDNAINLEVAKCLLERTQAQVTCLQSGQECLELVQKEHFDIIFMDHMMPGMDGVETLTELIKMEENLCGDSPVIAVTANASAGAKEDYLAYGFDNFISKPIAYKELEQMIMYYLPSSKYECITIELSAN